MGSARGKIRRCVLAVGLGSVLAASGCAKPASDSPNIIVLMVDTLRPDYLGFQGFSGPVSPNLDALVAESVVYDNCFTQSPWTKPSVASLFTSLYPQVHGLTNHEGKYWGEDVAEARTGVLSEQAVTLAEQLARSGYRTAGFVSNPWIKGDYGFAQGFELYDDSGTEQWVRADALLDSARAWVDALPDDGRPFFVYLHFMDVHAPYSASKEDFDALIGSESLGPRTTLEERNTPHRRFGNIERKPRWATKELRRELTYWRARYASGVHAFDRRVAPFVEFLRREGLLDDTLLVLTSDHGEELYEHGSWSHGQNLYDHQLHIPLLVRKPLARDGGTRVGRIVELIDLMPTLLSLAGVELPSGLQGRDISPLELEDDDRASLATATQTTPGAFSLRTTRYKFHHDFRSHVSRLYDIRADPGELRDIAPKQRSLVADFERRLNEFIAATLLDGTLEFETVEVSKELQDRLKALGYVD